MPMGRNWYVAPVCTVDPENGYHPGEGDGSTCPGFIPDLIVHAYMPDPRVVVDEGDPDVEGDETYQVPTTCLVGSPANESGRPGWASKTLGQAQSEFQAAHSRVPSDDEVS